jgi:transposase
MIGPRAGTRVRVAAGVTDMRCGIDTLAVKVQTALTEDPHSEPGDGQICPRAARRAVSPLGIIGSGRS